MNSEKNMSVYIVLSCNDTFIGKVIRKRAKLKFWNRYAGDHYNHTSLSLDMKLDNMMSFARKRVNNPFISGLVQESIHTGIFARSGEKSRIAVMRIPVSESQFRMIQKSMQEYWSRRDVLKYNFPGLFTMLLYARGVNIKNKYICSHWVADVLEQSGVRCFEAKRSCDVRPFDFYDEFSQYLIYEGLTIEWQE